MISTRRLGPGAPTVSAVGFGGMQLSISDRPSEDVAIRVLHASLGAGVTLIDTADVYCLDDDDLGHNERLIAKALRNWSGQRDSIVVATKGGLTRPQGHWETDGTPEHLRLACERSLKALGVDCIDLYQLHAPDPKVSFEDTVGELGRLQDSGKIRMLGLSNVSTDQIHLASSLVTVVTVQNRLNPFFREAITDGVLGYCETQGLGFLAYSPVGGGRLNKKLPEHPILTSIAQNHEVSTHAAALAWVLHQSPNVVIIPGARTADHAVDSARAARITLSDDELRVLDQATFSTV